MTVRGGKQIHHHQIGAAQRFIIFAGFGNRGNFGRAVQLPAFRADPRCEVIAPGRP
jgi:hypothetical protein